MFIEMNHSEIIVRQNLIPKVDSGTIGATNLIIKKRIILYLIDIKR